MGPRRSRLIGLFADLEGRGLHLAIVLQGQHHGLIERQHGTDRPSRFLTPGHRRYGQQSTQDGKPEHAQSP